MLEFAKTVAAKLNLKETNVLAVLELLADVKETVAVRVFCMTVLDNLSKHYPEIKQELRVILQDQLEQGCTAGFRSRASKILRSK